MNKITIKIAVLAVVALLASMALSRRQQPVVAASNQMIVTVAYTQQSLRSESVDSTIKEYAAGGWRFISSVPSEMFNGAGVTTRVVTLIFQK